MSTKKSIALILYSCNTQTEFDATLEGSSDGDRKGKVRQDESPDW
jgi:hypothetical protein